MLPAINLNCSHLFFIAHSTEYSSSNPLMVLILSSESKCFTLSFLGTFADTVAVEIPVKC